MLRPSPTPKPTSPRSPLPAPPTWNIDRALTTTTSQPPQTTEKIVPLLSVSPDGSKTRLFHAKYFLPVQSDPSTSRMVDLPESYFAPTAVELQTAFAGQVKKREDLLERPLMTQRLRDREEATKSRERASRWPQTRIRVRFADRSQLEGVFPSTDKMVAIYEFVKLALSEEIRQTPFLLYQTPPRREFPKGDLNSRGKSLMDLELTPSSVFYIKFLERQELDTMKPPPLRPELIGAAVQFPLPPPFDPTAKPPPDTIGKKTSTGQKLGFGGSSGKVTPSWMKLGKK
ncbi:BZ3500_MvSof-1268-A1-R1_Chr3-3g06396 [Microbotryum saponariae]|uniref:BZ3500_MvSof-1268-A1-R1_Chr3-3g06396 protein n=1 Tax=Microbotryum saponariae TaxID=289078 RepID=A0A2X0KXC5_9BASI|nr:BZ3500_MvSof-1268-A1-R1_Chr3-3g06396 [Microbotryum saponariae]SDA04363.1 BZ3501_MvSof-1269-A2-R1_Chr3-2g06083 [Microbotryum saponariae]